MGRSYPALLDSSGLASIAFAAWRLRRGSNQRQKSQDTPYDAVLAFESLAQFLSTGEIQFLQHAESQLRVAEAAR